MRKQQLVMCCLLGVLAAFAIAGCGEKKAAEVPAQEKTEEKPDDTEKEKQLTAEEQNIEEQNIEDQLENTQGEGDSAEVESSSAKEKEPQKEETLQAQFTITEKTYEEGDIHITYPYIENLVNQQITDFYNQEFESCINAYAGEAEEGDIAGNSEEASQTYQVTYQSKNMVSILIEGSFYSEGAAHPYSYTRTYNINLKTGENMSAVDYFTPQEITDDIMAFRNITVMGEIGNESIKQELEMKGMDGVLEQLSHCDFDFIVGKDGEITQGEDSPYSYSYRQEDGKWLIVLEGTHAAGDYFTLRYEK